MLGLIASFLSIGLGFMLKYSSQDGYSEMRKYWLFFVASGILTIIYKSFKHFG
ncbi:hypothetical protein EDF67_104474 [Sphingobacterium sp. JUb78]|nr:hypothetical protein [Sphingobacterium sp. JUb21]MCW2259824.1 hypothetical protein [Sphingobacterium kitahiroshimense]TCR08808.1 hypothetical protein EDF66_103360 [Sphingobacterium sp. JUb20]TCR11376.1 hypothetical protein EDF67_104474 [Sphingobacterium sp. JUb78]